MQRIFMRFLMILAVSFFPSFGHTQGQESSVAPGFIIGEAQDAIEELIEFAFDRLDFTLLAAAMEARATINSASLQFQDALTTSIDELDAQQRRILTDIKSITQTADNSIEKFADEIKTGTNQTLSDIRLLVSNRPGATYVSVRPSIVDDAHFDVQVEGTALSNATMKDFRVSTVPVKPSVVSQDDGKIVYRVPMKVLKDIQGFDPETEVPIEVQVAFSFVEEGFWPWSSDDIRPFTATAIFLPKRIGEVQAIFSVTREGVERRPQTRGPFTSKKVKSRVKLSGIKAGKRSDTWVASPSEGWRIDLSTAKYKFEEVNKNCSNSRSNAGWSQQTEQILRVATTSSSVRKAGATCRTRTTISFVEWKPTRKEEDAASAIIEAKASDTVRLNLENRENLKSARLSHIEVSSPMFGAGTRIFRLGDLPQGVSAEYDEASQAVFFTIGYR